jgi:SNF2 family DNA or RNA helicase
VALKYAPHAYQEFVLTRMEEKGVLALLLDPGMGKTSICLEDFRRRHSIADASRALVVAPLRTCKAVWPQEGRKWLGFNRFNIHVAHGVGKTVEAVNAADITVINPEGLAWMLKEAKNINWFDCAYIDESTLFKTASSKRSKNLFKLLHAVKGGVPYRFILTGTPAPNGVADLYGQFGLLDPSILGRTLGEFRSKYQFACRRAPWGMMWEPGVNSPELIQKAIAPHSARLDATDHLDLPGIVKVKRQVALPVEAMQLYKKLKEDMFADLESGEVVAINPGVLSAKCRQVANGAVYLTEIGEGATEETRKIEYIHTAKCEALDELWQELGQKPIMVAYEYKHDLTQIKMYMKEHHKMVPRYIGGGVPEDEIAESIEQWNRGELPMLLVNPQSAAHGLNLQAGGHHLCWFSMTWNLEYYQQLNGRLWRQGQSEGVFVHHLIADKTVDEVVWKAIEHKNTTQTKLLTYLKELR